MFVKQSCEKCVLVNGGTYVNNRYSIKYNALGIVTCVYDKVANVEVTNATVLSDAQIIIDGILAGTITETASSVTLTATTADVTVVNCSVVPTFGFDDDVRCYSTTAGGTPEVQLEVNYKYDMSVSPRQVVGVESAIVLESTNATLLAGNRYGLADIVFTAANFEEGAVTIDDTAPATSYLTVAGVTLFEVPCAICADCA